MVENRFIWSQHFTNNDIDAIVAEQAVELELLRHRVEETASGKYVKVSFLDTEARDRFFGRFENIKELLEI